MNSVNFFFRSIDHFSDLEIGFEIPDADYDKLYTVQAVVDYLGRKMNVTERPKPVVSSSPDPRHGGHH